MKATALFRTAGVLLFVAAAGNTYGLLMFWHVAGAMAPVRFPIGHSDFSWAQVVLGYQVFASFCIAFAAYLTWHLGTVARTSPQAVGLLGWILFAYALMGIYVSKIFLSGFVLLLSIVIAICIGWAAWLSTGARRHGKQPHEQAASTTA